MGDVVSGAWNGVTGAATDWWKSPVGPAGSTNAVGNIFGIGGGGGSPWGLQNPGQPPALPGYETLQNPDGTPYKTPGVATAASPQNAQAALLGDPALGHLDQSGLNANRDLAMGTGPTAWGQLQHEQNALTTAGLRDNAEATAASSSAAGLDQLGMNGGYTGGAAERMAQSGAQGRNIALQGIGRDAAARDLQTSIADQGRRDTALSALPGQQLQAGQFDQANAGIQNARDTANVGAQNNFAQFNAGNQNANNQFNASAQNQNNQFGATQAETEAQRHSAFDAANYNSLAGIYGGINQANGTIAAAAAGKKSGTSFLCTELRAQGLMSAFESKRMVDFMLRGLASRADFFLWYFRGAEKLVQIARQRGEDWKKLKAASVTEVLALIKAGKEHEAQDQYIRVVRNLNLSHGMPMGPMPRSILEAGFIKSAIALPLVFCLKSTWRWIGSFANAYYKRRVRKLMRSA